MSWRTLIEFNHDITGRAIEQDPQGFVDALRFFNNSACDRNAEELKRFGITVIRTRHHSDSFMSQLPPERIP
jgi:hypothetical protein